MLCDTAGVGELCRCLSTGSPFGHHPRLRMVRPRWGRWMHTGKLSFLNLSPTDSPFKRPRRGRWMHTGKLSFLNLSPHGFTL